MALLERCPEVRNRLQKRYKHILVDEFQDTNAPQYEMVRLLAGSKVSHCTSPLCLPGLAHLYFADFLLIHLHSLCVDCQLAWLAYPVQMFFLIHSTLCGLIANLPRPVWFGDVSQSCVAANGVDLRGNVSPFSCTLSTLEVSWVWMFLQEVDKQRHGCLHQSFVHSFTQSFVHSLIRSLVRTRL